MIGALPRSHSAPRRAHGGGAGSAMPARIARIAATLHEASDSSPTLPALPDGTVVDAAEAVATLTALTASRIATERSAATRQLLAAILNELQRVALDLHLEGMSSTSARLSAGSQALARLRGARGTSELLESVCAEIVRSCGFDRVVLSRVNGTTWNPWLAHSTASDALDTWFPTWVGSTIDIDARAPEHKTLTIRRPVLVRDTATEAVHRPIIVDAGRSRSYVVAPLICQGSVIGFLHADHLSGDTRVVDVDREVLWAFSSGLGFLYERVMLQDTLRRNRQQAHDILAGAAESILAFAEQEAVGDASRAPLLTAAGRHDGGQQDPLTKREGEVLHLMAEGLTNAAIAERLVLSSDTIKSHVKHILRKLEVSNRSQAVTHYLSA